MENVERLHFLIQLSNWALWKYSMKCCFLNSGCFPGGSQRFGLAFQLNEGGPWIRCFCSFPFLPCKNCEKVQDVKNREAVSMFFTLTAGCVLQYFSLLRTVMRMAREDSCRRALLSKRIFHPPLMLPPPTFRETVLQLGSLSRQAKRLRILNSYCLCHFTNL